MSEQRVQLKKTITVSVTADKVTAITATLESGRVVPVEGPIALGDYNITDEAGKDSILSATDFAAELVTPAA